MNTGILPFMQSTKFAHSEAPARLLEKAPRSSAFLIGALVDHGWELPGSGQPRVTCGDQQLRGCDNVDKHIEGFGRPPGSVYVELYKRKCMRAVCPECYEAWASREGEAAEHRMDAYQKTLKQFKKPIHVILSPPAYDVVDYRAFRREAYTIAKMAGVNAGMVIFHPWRKSKGVVTEGSPYVTKAWEYSPHFHILGFGWVCHTSDIHDKTGWVVKNRGVRKSTRRTISYLLTHTGISENVHSVTWWGELSYNKLKIAKMPAERPTCPMCESHLIPLFDWSDVLGEPPPMDDVGRYWLKDEKWGQF